MMTCGSGEVAVAAAEGTRSGSIYHVFNAQTVAGCLGTAGHCYANHGSDLGMATRGKGPRADALRDAWLEFVTTGRVSAWATVNAQGGGPTTVVLQNNGTRSV